MRSSNTTSNAITLTLLSGHPAGRVVAPDLYIRPARDDVYIVGAPGVAALTTLRMAGAGGVGLTDELSYALRCTLTPPWTTPAAVN